MHQALFRTSLLRTSRLPSLPNRFFHVLRRTLSTNPSPDQPSPSTVPVNELRIPLEPAYSIDSLLSSASSAPSPSSLLSEPTLRKLHKLSALPYPSCTAEEMSDLIGVIEGVRGKEVSELLAQLERREREEGGEQGEEVGWGRRVVKIDVSGEEQGGKAGITLETEEGREKEPSGRDLLGLAQKTKGDFYVVQKARRGSE
jgi:hypothetical protein